MLALIAAGLFVDVYDQAMGGGVIAALLKAGENTIWVELGYADHTPFNPEIVDKVVVTVTPPASAPATATATATSTATP